MDFFVVQCGEQAFDTLPGNLEVQGIWAEIETASPDQLAGITNSDTLKHSAIRPGLENSLPGNTRKVGHPMHTVAKRYLNPVSGQRLHLDDPLHALIITYFKSLHNRPAQAFSPLNPRKPPAR